MGSFSIWHWLIVLLIVMLVFGTKKLRNIGEDLGGAVKGFKEGMREGTSESKSTDEPAQQISGGQTIEGEVKEKTSHNNWTGSGFARRADLLRTRLLPSVPGFFL